MAGGDIAFEYMQIGSADRRFCNFDDSVRRLDERGLGALQKSTTIRIVPRAPDGK